VVPPSVSVTSLTVFVAPLTGCVTTPTVPVTAAGRSGKRSRAAPRSRCLVYQGIAGRGSGV
jgi:hypothetical protein